MMKPIGINIPIRRGGNGFFDQTFTTTDAVKSNLKNILLTKHRERPLNPEFGLKLQSMLFENDLDILREQIKSEIERVVNKYEPKVIINNILFSDQNTDNQIGVKLIFSLRSYPSFQDELTLDIDTNT